MYWLTGYLFGVRKWWVSVPKAHGWKELQFTVTEEGKKTDNIHKWKSWRKKILTCFFLNNDSRDHQKKKKMDSVLINVAALHNLEFSLETWF